MENIKKAIKAKAEKHGLDPAIVYGVCMQESTLNPYAVRFEPKYRWLVYNTANLKPRECSIETEYALQKTSFGLMQVMGAVIREQGVSGWLTQAVGNVDMQLEYGCRHLKKKIQRYGLMEGILSYNSGSPRKDASGKYFNQYYYDRVTKFARGWHA
jgi:soluble lytic murein transglycosylase-like protein